MKEFKRTIVRLTSVYSLIFFLFIWSFSAGIYVWTNNSLGEGYVNRINNTIERSHTGTVNTGEFSDDTAVVAADIALDRLRNILLIVNILAIIIIPLVAYFLSKYSLRPLVRSQQRQRQFISYASHELRTPLAVMSGELELATKRTRTVPEYKATIANTATEVKQMIRLTNNLLLLEQTDASKLRIEKIVLAERIESIVANYKTIIASKHLEIITQGDDRTIVQFDSELLSIVLQNLIDNAIKYSHDRSTINLSYESKDNQTFFSIENRGELLSNDDMANIFNRFYQTKSSNEGFGLGLAIVKQILDRHGATIAVRSTSTSVIFKIKF